MSKLTTQNLAENQAVPKWMRIITRSMQLIQFSFDCLPEERTLQPRHATSSHRGLIYSVQDPWNGREEVRL